MASRKNNKSRRTRSRQKAHTGKTLDEKQEYAGRVKNAKGNGNTTDEMNISAEPTAIQVTIPIGAEHVGDNRQRVHMNREGKANRSWIQWIVGIASVVGIVFPALIFIGIYKGKIDTNSTEIINLRETSSKYNFRLGEVHTSLVRVEEQLKPLTKSSQNINSFKEQDKSTHSPIKTLETKTNNVDMQELEKIKTRLKKLEGEKSGD